MNTAMRNRVAGRLWQLGRDRRRHRGNGIRVIGLAPEPAIAHEFDQRPRGGALVVLLALIFLLVGVALSDSGAPLTSSVHASDCCAPPDA
jgi:hypothetical protein